MRTMGRGKLCRASLHRVHVGALGVVDEGHALHDAGGLQAVLDRLEGRQGLGEDPVGDPRQGGRQGRRAGVLLVMGARDPEGRDRQELAPEQFQVVAHHEASRLVEGARLLRDAEEVRLDFTIPDKRGVYLSLTFNKAASSLPWFSNNRALAST
jgi:hypothetical protein